MRKFILIAEIITLFLLLSACSENPPVIEQLFWQSNRFNDLEENAVYDTLSVFLQVSDPDGIDDIASLYIINDSQELFWKIENQNLVIKENNDVSWIGSNRLKMDNLSMFPSGEYRIIVLDEAGERMETSFTLKNSSFMPEKFPELVIKENSVTADNLTDVIWMYDAEGAILSENYTDINFKTFPVIENTEEIYISGFDKINGIGLTSGPYKVK